MKKKRSFLNFLIIFFMIFSFSTIKAWSEKLSTEDGSKILNEIEKGGGDGVSLDLNLRISIPEQKDFSAIDLWATLISPGKDKKNPTILVATPYRREIFAMLYLPLVQHGYNLLVVDIRGTGSSNGEWESFDLVEHYDTMHIVDKWIPSQEWSDGKVGMLGPSYLGIVQMLAAGLVERDSKGEPVHLKAIFPLVPKSDAYRDIVFHGGNVDLEFIPMWLGMVDILGAVPPLLFLGEDGPNIEDLQESMDIWLGHLNHIPDTINWIMDASHRLDGDFYDKKSPMIYWPDKPDGGWGFYEGDNCVIPDKLPVFMVGGWFDIFTRGTLNNYQYGLKNHSTSDKALFIGEWYHLGGSLGLGVVPLENCELPARWFNWKIRGKADPFMEEFPVVMRVMGEKRWRAEKSWPLPSGRVDEKTLYLSKVKGDLIENDFFTNKETNQIYSLVPERTTADIIGENPVLEHKPELFLLHGATSRSSVRWLMGVQAIVAQVKKYIIGIDVDAEQFYEDERSDDWRIPTFTTAELKEDVEIVGPLSLTFWAETEFSSYIVQKKADLITAFITEMLGMDSVLLLDVLNEKTVQWVVELNDVFPEGRARNITSGWLNATHRQYDPLEGEGTIEHALDPGYRTFDPFYDRPDREPLPVNENELYQYTIELWPTCNVFKKGHRIRLTISGSDFPHLLPVLWPSKNTIVIDEHHEARLDFKTANRKDEGVTWKWIEKAGPYLMSHKDGSSSSGGTVKADIEESEKDISESIVSGAGGCGSDANASIDAGDSMRTLSGMFGLIAMMFFPFSVIMLHRYVRRRRFHE